MHYTTVIKDAFRQIVGRMMSAFSGFFVTVLLTQALGPLRYGDYTTILSYFALWSALADLGLYVIGLRELGKIKAECGITDSASFAAADKPTRDKLSLSISQFVWSRLAQIVIVYGFAVIVAYCIPSYVANDYIFRGLPFGMIFSALFMMAGILQLPLQLFWKMEHVSIGLVIARLSQIAFLLLIVWSGWWDLGAEHVPISLFVAVVASVVVSSLSQTLYTIRMGYRIVPLRMTPFWGHMIRHIKENGKYGAAFFLSSFHLLVVGLLFSILYPTVDGYLYVGIWGLALQLVQILLIIPASLANSMIHRISATTVAQQTRSFGQMLMVMLWFGGLCFSNFFIFAPHIVYFVSGSKYLSNEGITWTFSGLQLWWQKTTLLTQSSLGSDIILPFLGLVLALSFIKTVFNYVFVAAKHQNLLFPINLVGVLIGGSAALALVHYYTILGGIVAQLFMEILFVVGSCYYAYRYHILPRISFSKIFAIIAFFVIVSILGFVFPVVQYDEKIPFIICFAVYNIIVFALRYKPLKGLFKSMSDYTTDIVLEDEPQIAL